MLLSNYRRLHSKLWWSGKGTICTLFRREIKYDDDEWRKGFLNKNWYIPCFFFLSTFNSENNLSIHFKSEEDLFFHYTRFSLSSLIIFNFIFNYKSSKLEGHFLIIILYSKFWYLNVFHLMTYHTLHSIQFNGTNRRLNWKMQLSHIHAPLTWWDPH